MKHIAFNGKNIHPCLLDLKQDITYIGLLPSRACYGVLRFIMESGAKGCEVVVSGKLRGQRAKSMKFVDGLMIHSGDPVNYYVDTAVRHVLLRQGETLNNTFTTSVIILSCLHFL